MHLHGEVTVDHHLFTLAQRDADTLAVTQDSSLLQLGTNFLTVRAGIAYGPAELTVDSVQSRPTPALDGWDTVAEASIKIDNDLTVLTLDGAVTEEFAALSEYRYGVCRFRVHALGRDSNWDLEVSAPTERFWIQIWPVSGASADVGVVQELKRTDQVWPGPFQQHPPPAGGVGDSSLRIASAAVLSGDESGRRTRIRRGSSRTDARVDTDQLLRSPSITQLTAVVGTGPVVALLALDRRAQRLVAAELAKRACARVGISEIDWVHDALEDIRSHVGRTPAVNRAAVYAATGEEPIEETVSTSLLDGRSIIRERVAASAIVSASQPDESVAAVTTLRLTVEVFEDSALEAISDIWDSTITP